MFAVAFQNALRENDVAKVQQIIESSDPHHPPSYYSMLDDAISTGRREIVKLLLDKGNCDVNERNFNGGTPLHSAVLQLCESLTWADIVMKILAKGAHIGLQDNDGNTPIHLAFLNGASGEVMDFLLGLYVKPLREEIDDYDNSFKVLFLKKGRVNKNGLSVYHIACTRSHLDILRTLTFHGLAKKNDLVSLKSKCAYAGYTPLHFAVASRQCEVAEFLLNGKANVYVADNNGSTPLHLALQRGDSEMIELLLPRCNADRDMIDKLGYSHFMAACVSSETTYVKDYLRAAAAKNPDSPADSIKQQVNPIAIIPFAGYTPLHFAVVGGNHEVVEILLEHGADFHARDVNCTTPLHLALYLREEAMIQRLLFKDDFLGDVTDVFGISHFMAACAAAEPVIVEEFLRVAEIRLESSQQTLINAKVNNDVPIYAGYTSLHFAVEFSNYEVVKLLLDRDVDALYTQDVDGSTPLHLALENGDTMMIDLILTYDGLTENVVNNCGLSHFMAACAGSEVAIVKEYLRVSDLRSETSTTSSSSLVGGKTNDCPYWYSGFSPIHFAAQFERVETVELLLNYGVDDSVKLKLSESHEGGEESLLGLGECEDSMRVDDDNLYSECDFEKESMDFNCNVMD